MKERSLTGSKKQLKTLAVWLETLARKATAALPGDIAAIVSWLLKTAGSVAVWLAEHLWASVLALVHLTDGLQAQLNFDNDDNGWFDSGTYVSDRPVDLASPEALYIHLEQLNTAGNFVNGAPSTLLTVVEISRNPAFGSTSTIRFETLELKRLSGGFVSELKVTIRDHTGAVSDNNLQPIPVVLEIQKEK